MKLDSVFTFVVISLFLAAGQVGFVHASNGALQSIKKSSSVNVLAKGVSCINPSVSENETISRAISNAKKEAANELVLVRGGNSEKFVSVESGDAGYMAEEAMTVVEQAYSEEINSIVRQVGMPNGEWKIGEDGRRCYYVEFEVEVILAPMASEANALDDPRAPLNVDIWTDRTRNGVTAVYRVGEKLRFSFKANRDFYARIVSLGSDGGVYQVVPSPAFKNNFFKGGVVHKYPPEGVKNDIKIGLPTGSEKLFIVACESLCGDLDLKQITGVNHAFIVNESAEDVAKKSRSIRGNEDAARKLDRLLNGSVQIETATDFVDFITVE